MAAAEGLKRSFHFYDPDELPKKAVRMAAANAGKAPVPSRSTLKRALARQLAAQPAPVTEPPIRCPTAPPPEEPRVPTDRRRATEAELNVLLVARLERAEAAEAERARQRRRAAERREEQRRRWEGRRQAAERSPLQTIKKHQWLRFLRLWAFVKANPSIKGLEGKDRSLVRDAPVFHPTAEEFADPVQYVLAIQDQAEPFGLCKIVPPPGWSPALQLRDTFAFKTRHQLVSKHQQWHPGADDAKVGFLLDAKPIALGKFRDAAHQMHRRTFPQLRPEEVDPVLAEHAFWETHGADPAVHVRYGSDVPGSVFGLAAAGDRHVQPPAPSTPPMANAASSSCSEPFTSSAPSVPRFHPGTLKRSPHNLLRHCPGVIPGVTDPMLYISMLFSLFCWHREDLSLYSLSYNHHGCAKTWYGVPGAQAARVEAAARRLADRAVLKRLNRGQRKRLLLRKDLMINPLQLTEHGITVSRLQHLPGEMVVTFPGAYHSGFNAGFGYAEAVNFATWRWLEHGRRTTDEYRALGQMPCLSYELLLHSAVLDMLQARSQHNPGGPEVLCTLKQEWDTVVARQAQQTAALEAALQRLAGPPASTTAPAVRVHSADMAGLQRQHGLPAVMCVKCKTLCFNRAVQLAAPAAVPAVRPIILCPDCLCESLNAAPAAGPALTRWLARVLCDPFRLVDETDYSSGEESSRSSAGREAPPRDLDFPVDLTVHTLHPLQHFFQLQAKLARIQPRAPMDK